MVFTTAGLSGVQNAIATISTNRPQYMAIGTGSSTAAAANNTLVSEALRRLVTTTDVTAANTIAYVADWNSVEMSGLSFSELGMFTTSGVSTGSLWNRDCFTAVVFDGTNDLQVQLTYTMS